MTPDSLPPSEHPLDDLRIVAMTAADVESCAAIAAHREGDDIGPWRMSFRRRLIDADSFVLVARLGWRVVGYGVAARLTPESDGGRAAPEGWYLAGLVVTPDLRRRGIGGKLTLARMELLRLRTSRVYCFANARNQASIALHEAAGFTELTRDFAIPGVSFDGGEGILFETGFCPDGDVVIRPYGEPTDADDTRYIFRRAIRGTASRFYDRRQVEAWARRGDQSPDWAARRARPHGFVAVIDGVAVGFTEIDDTGYLDMMFVAPEAAGRSVASQLLNRALAAVPDVARVTAHASEAAVGFFRAKGFTVEAECHPRIGEVELTNYLVSFEMGSLGNR